MGIYLISIPILAEGHACIYFFFIQTQCRWNSLYVGWHPFCTWEHSLVYVWLASLRTDLTPWSGKLCIKAIHAVTLTWLERTLPAGYNFEEIVANSKISDKQKLDEWEEVCGLNKRQYNLFIHLHSDSR